MHTLHISVPFCSVQKVSKWRSTNTQPAVVVVVVDIKIRIKRFPCSSPVIAYRAPFHARYVPCRNFFLLVRSIEGNETYWNVTLVPKIGWFVFAQKWNCVIIVPMNKICMISPIQIWRHQNIWPPLVFLLLHHRYQSQRWNLSLKKRERDLTSLQNQTTTKTFVWKNIFMCWNESVKKRWTAAWIEPFFGNKYALR